MALPLLIFLLLPAHNHALKIICDPSVGGEWHSHCDFLQVNGELNDEDNAIEHEDLEQFGFLPENSLRAREERAVELTPGLRLPAANQCPEDLMLSRLVSRVLDGYFNSCVPVLRYDRFLENSCGVQKLLSGELTQGYTHGRLSGSNGGIGQSPVPRDGKCAVLVFLVQHVEDIRAISRAGTSHDSALLLVTASPLWRIDEFLAKWEGRPWKLFILASAHRKRPVVSTKYLKPWFPNQLNVAVRHEPPYSIHRPNETGSDWTGIERTIFDLLAYKLNFTFNTKIMPEYEGTAPLREAVAGASAEVGAGGVFFETTTPDLTTTAPYTRDCAVFLTRASTALPKHRAILGPFQLTVWLVLTLVYMALAVASALSPDSKDRPNTSQTRLDAFWLVYGTFTNAFFVRGRVWSERMSIRILLTCYWIFTVIITAAYTSSIIAFVTLPVFPDTIDSAEEILSTPDFRWGTQGSAGWKKWLQDSDDAESRYIQAGFEWLPRVEDGVRNVSRSAKYAFLGSKNRLQYESSDDLAGILSGKKALHLGSQCFIPLLPAFLITPALRPAIDPWLLLFSQNGFIVKADRDIAFQEHRRRLRSAKSGGMRVEFTRKLPHERRLSVEDVVGTFFVLGSGVIMGFTSLACERVIHWFKVNQIAARISSTVDKARRKVSALSGSNSGGSSRQSLRLRSGRIWSKGGRGSRLGSMLEMVPEPPDSPSEEHKAQQHHHHEPMQDVIPLPDAQNMVAATSLPHLERQPTHDEEELQACDELTEVRSLQSRPFSSGK